MSEQEKVEIEEKDAPQEQPAAAGVSIKEEGDKKVAGDKGAKASKEKIGGRKLAKKKKNIRLQVQKGRIYVRSTYNNTSVVATDLHGNTLAWATSGLLGFKGAKKSTTYAASQVVFDLYEKVQKFGLKEVDVYVKGVGAGRDSAVRTLSQKGFVINAIKDETPIPHNGCRPPKPRRV